MIYQACSVHEPLLAAAGTGRVLSNHRQAVNLAMEGGALVSLLDPVLGNGPGAVLVPAPWPLTWSPGERATLAHHLLRGPGCTVRLDGAALWVPQAPPGRVERAVDPQVLSGVGAALAADGNPAGLLPAVLSVLGIPEPKGRQPDRTADVLLQMGLQGIRLLLAGDLATAVLRLAGLGPGATPSGDDLLCGFTCTLVRAGHKAAAELCTTIRSLPPLATTPLSRHFLHWATMGVAQEHALQFVDQLLRGQGADPGPVLSHGATSGADWASGALLAFYYLGREVSRREAV